MGREAWQQAVKGENLKEHISNHKQSRESKLEVNWGYELSKPIPSETFFFPVRYYLIKVS